LLFLVNYVQLTQLQVFTFSNDLHNCVGH